MGPSSAIKVIFFFHFILALAVPSLAASYVVTWTKTNLASPGTLLQLSNLHAGDTINFLNPDLIPIYQVSKAEYDGCLQTPNRTVIGRQLENAYTIPGIGDFFLVSDLVDCLNGVKLQLHAT
nr:uncharacterized protein LOC113710970 [Coffea arabica]